MIPILIILISTILLISIYFTINSIITKSRLKDNQNAWNEYSKNMTMEEKLECFNEWLEMRKVEKGWRYYYIPRM